MPKLPNMTQKQPSDTSPGSHGTPLSFDKPRAQPTPGSPQLPLCVRAKDMKTLFPFSRYSPKGPHSLNPTLPYRV